MFNVIWNMFVDIFDISISPEVFLHASIWLLILAIAIWFIRYYFLRRGIFKLCGVPTSKYRLLETNLIWPKNSINLCKDKLRGTPDTIFIRKDDGAAYVCLYNPRLYKGRAKVRERYQMLLYMGLIKEQHKLENIKGAIRYYDHLEFFKFEPVIYRGLLGLQDEYSEAVKEWVAPNKQPLFKREKLF